MESAATCTRPRPASIPNSSRPTHDVTPLKEEDAYPAQPQDAYGWEKLVTERLCIHYARGLRHGDADRPVPQHLWPAWASWDGGREKAPAAMCRKMAMAKLTGNPEIEIWGDGEQTRSFCYIDDCVEGICRLMHSDFQDPLNLGQDRHGDDQPTGRYRREHRGCADS